MEQTLLDVAIPGEVIHAVWPPHMGCCNRRFKLHTVQGLEAWIQRHVFGFVLRPVLVAQRGHQYTAALEGANWANRSDADAGRVAAERPF